MNPFDIIFGIFASIFLIIGLWRGFIEEVMRLAAVVAGFISALVFYRQLSEKLSFLSFSPQITGVISFLVIFSACAIIIIIIGKLAKKAVNNVSLGWIDRLFGGFMGILKAFFIGWVFVISVQSIPFPGIRVFFGKSSIYAFFVNISPILQSHVINKAGAQIRKKIEEKKNLPKSNLWNPKNSGKTDDSTKIKNDKKKHVNRNDIL